MTSGVDNDLSDLQHAFRLLGAAELGQSPDWPGPQTADALSTRVELLADVLKIVPRSQHHRMKEVIADWRLQFPAGTVMTAPILRARARETLRRGPTDGGKDGRLGELERLEQLFGAEASQSARTPHEFSPNAKEQCTIALQAWGDKVRSLDEWKTLPNVVPGDAPIPLEDVYVDLAATRRTETGGLSFFETSDDRLRRRRESVPVDVASVVARTFQNCVVLGEPGSGKSTLVTWLVWATYKGKLRDFDFALAVRLREYAAELQIAPELSMLDFFFRRLRPVWRDVQEATDCLRSAAKAGGRFLLLLDGWDEVPADQREVIQRAIQSECGSFVIVVTSRVSGAPWQLFPRGLADYYEIAGLSPGAVRTFVENQLRVLGEFDRRALIQETLTTHEELRGLSANPFLLGLLVRALSMEPHISVPGRIELYDLVVRWIVKQQRLRPGTMPLQEEDLRGLERLSFTLMLLSPSPQYVFNQSQLERHLAPRPTRPLVESRFICQLDPDYDSWSCLHATFEEYFAARQMAALSEPELANAWNKAFCSQARLVMLGFFADLPGAAQHANHQFCQGWLLRPDWFGMVPVRLAQLAARGRWLDRDRGLVAKIEDSLWSLISKDTNWVFVRQYVAAFAELDPHEILRLASRTAGIDSRVSETLCDVLPAEMIRASDLFAKLPPTLREGIAGRDAGNQNRAEIEALLRRLDDRTQSVPEFLSLVREASQIPDAAIAIRLLELLQAAEGSELADSLTLALANVFNCLPTDRILSLLIDDESWSSIVRRLASAALAHSTGAGARLDPSGRDALLSRLAVLNPHDARGGAILEALRGYPIREGGSLIAEFAGNHSLTPSVRTIAAGVLETVSDDEAVHAAVYQVPHERDEQVENGLLQLAIARDVALASDWLEERITCEVNSLRRRSLLAIYVAGARNPAGKTARLGQVFLARLIQDALTGGAGDAELKAIELASVLRQQRPNCEMWRQEGFTNAAVSLLKLFSDQPAGVSIGQVRLAATLLGIGRCRADLLENLLKLLIRRIRVEKERHLCLEMEALAQDVADFLADVAVGRLLTFPDSCDPVHEALGRRALELGWLVFDDRILDANGQELGSLGGSESAENEASQTSREALLSSLSMPLRSAIMSRWLVIVHFRKCDPSAPDKDIYQSVQRMVADEEGEVARELSRELYQDDLPSLGAWRQNVFRARKQLRKRREGLTFLAEIGLD
jgi:hypothetical protein